MGTTLTWEDSYAIALALIESSPNVELENVSLGMIYRWTLDLPGFDDTQILLTMRSLQRSIMHGLRRYIPDE